MQVTAIQTEKITHIDDLSSFIELHVPQLEEKSIVVVTSKIISILEGNVRDKSVLKQSLIKQESEYYIEESLWEKYHLYITRKRDILIANAGIDESNSNGKYILWPKDPFQSAITIWNALRTRRKISDLGVIVTDSRLTPLRWGTLGLGIAWCGFEPLNDYRGTPDIFGEPLKVTQSSILDGLAASAVLCMGEGKEQTPLCTITNIPFVHFVDHSPSADEINRLSIAIEEDIYAPILVSEKWKKGEA